MLVCIDKIKNNLFNILLFVFVISFFIIFCLNINISSKYHRSISINKNEIVANKIKAPNFICQNFEEIEKLNKNCKIIKLCEEFSEQIPEGYIISQDPYPGDYMNLNSVIAVKVSKGTQNKVLPDIFGLTISEASKILTDLKLIPIEKRIPSEPYDVGRTIGYDAYEPGEIVKYGEKIVINVGR